MPIFNRTLPFNTLPLLPPKAEIETRRVLKKLTPVSRALMELREKCKTLPNQSVLINRLVLLEAKDSSEIEKVFTTHEDMFRGAINEETASPETKEVKRYGAALIAGISSLKKRPLGTNTFVEVMQSIKLTTQEIRTEAGTQIKNDTTEEIIYTPPSGEALLRKLLGNLETYIHDTKDDIDPLIKMAVIHYQFEAIHPFVDGNGRTGRILNILYLCDQGLLETPILFLSRYFIQNNRSYNAGLQKVTEEQDWENWILYMLSAVEETARHTTDKINSIQTGMNYFAQEYERIMKKPCRKEMLEQLFYSPFFQISDIQIPDIKSRQTIASRLNQLEENNLLGSFMDGKNKIFVNTILYKILKNN